MNLEELSNLTDAQLEDYFTKKIDHRYGQIPGSQIDRSDIPVVRKQFDPLSVFLRDSDPSDPYKSTAGKTFRTFKFSRLKFLSTTFLWLINHWDVEKYPTAILVVAGGAPGGHYPVLSRLFPGLEEIHLWDTEDAFSKSSLPDYITSHPETRIRLFRELLTPERASELYTGDGLYGQKSVLFESDIRTIGHKPNRKGKSRLVNVRETDDITEIEKGILADHELQRQIMLALLPISSQLKFRPPYMYSALSSSFTHMKYLDGYVYHQVFLSKKSTETRLVPIQNENGQYTDKTYYSGDYENKLFSYNTKQRDDIATTGGVATVWQNSINGSEIIPSSNGLNNSYDTMYFLHVLDKYLDYIDHYSSQGITNPHRKFIEVMALWNYVLKMLTDVLNARPEIKYNLVPETGLIDITFIRDVYVRRYTKGQ